MKSVSTNILEGIKNRKLVEGEKVDYYGLEEYVEDNFEAWSQSLFSDGMIAYYIFSEGFNEEDDDKKDIDLELFDKVYDDVASFFSKKETEIIKYTKEVLKKYNYCRAKVGKNKKISESVDINIDNLRPNKEYFMNVCNFLNNTGGRIEDYQVRELLNMLADGMGLSIDLFSDSDIGDDIIKTLSDNVENDEEEDFVNNLVSYLKIKANK